MKSKPGHVNIFNLIHSGIVKRKRNQYSICQNEILVLQNIKPRSQNAMLKKPVALRLCSVSVKTPSVFLCGVLSFAWLQCQSTHQIWKMTTCTFLYGLSFSVLLRWNETFGFCPTFYVTSQPDYHRRLHSLKRGQSITGRKLVATFPVS